MFLGRGCSRHKSCPTVYHGARVLPLTHQTLTHTHPQPAHSRTQRPPSHCHARTHALSPLWAPTFPESLSPLASRTMGATHFPWPYAVIGWRAPSSTRADWPARVARLPFWPGGREAGREGERPPPAHPHPSPLCVALPCKINKMLPRNSHLPPPASPFPPCTP